MKDTQDRRPKVGGDLERVGITNLKTMIQTTWKGRSYRFTPKVEITIDLDRKRKGVHMSRLVEAIAEAVEEEADRTHSSIEGLGRSILERLGLRHPYRRGEVRMSMDFMTERRTPVTGKKTMEAHDVEVSVSKDGGRYGKRLKVSVLGSTVCPHSMEAAGKPHIQRAIGELEVSSDYGRKIALEDMVVCVEESFSSEAYTLLKTEDETYVVDKMYANPKFVEDVAREIIHNAKKRFRGCRIRSKVISQESIHRHDVIAEGSADSLSR